MLYIKLKNKSEICVMDWNVNYERSCKWCGKVIKPGKTHFRGVTGTYADGEFCSASHIKVASNSRL